MDDLTPQARAAADNYARPYWYAPTPDAWKGSRPGQGKGGGRKRAD